MQETKQIKKNIKIVLIALLVLLIVGSAALLVHQREEFIGNRTKNTNTYLLDIERMNGTDLHTLELLKGDILHIRFKKEQGSMYMQIKAPDGEIVYRGNGRETTEFTLNITQSGVYAVVVEAHHTKGFVHIRPTTIPTTNK